jgi:hypothetical protein
MSLRLGALHDALLDPGNAEKAQRAAEEVAGYDKALADLRGDMLLVKWMLGVLIALVLGVFWQGFSIMGRLP